MLLVICRHSLSHIRSLSGLQYWFHPHSTRAYRLLPFQLAAHAKGDIHFRTSPWNVQQAYALIREDIDKADVLRSDLVAQAIHLVMESARVGLNQHNPGAVVGAISQLAIAKIQVTAKDPHWGPRKGLS